MYSILTSGSQEITVLLSGEIDHHSTITMREEIDREIEKQNPKSLILDFSKVSFMDSSGIGLVMGRYKLINSMGGKLYILNVPKSLKKVMEISGINKLADIKEIVQPEESIIAE